MKTPNSLSSTQNGPGKPADSAGFFRELEIEFLIHELKDPIAIIETGMRALLEKREKFGELSLKQERTLKRALRNSQKMREMLNGLLEVGRSEAGRIHGHHFFPAESLYIVLQETLEIIGSIPDQSDIPHDDQAQFLSGHGIFLEIAPEMHQSRVFQDEIKFQQIVGNLLKNAIYHRQERVTVTMNQDDARFWITVSDDGPGIDPEYHQAIFERYTQVSVNPNVQRKGHGLGLAGALVLARSLGGSIEVMSKKGQGATFRVILPIELAL